MSETGIPELYATVDLDNDKNIKHFFNKSSTGFGHAFIGLAAIKQHDVFWQELEKYQGSGEVVSAFYNLSSYDNFKAKHLDWTDVGTIDGYLKARNNKHSLPKNTGECLYNIKDDCPSCGREANGKCVKLFPHDTKDKMSRVSELKDFYQMFKVMGHMLFRMTGLKVVHFMKRIG